MEIHRYDDLVDATYVGRPNRFTLRVRVDGVETDAYLRNSGGLDTVLDPGRDVLCRPVADADRKTDFDAIAVHVDDRWVTLDATLPNRVVERCVERNALSAFERFTVDRTEPPLPGGGRTDLRLRRPQTDTRDAASVDEPDSSHTGPAPLAYVEVKSNTHVVDGVAKFPDRPTERGRRHLRDLVDLHENPSLADAARVACHVVFVVQRADARCVRPFREVDPEFADLLSDAAEAGVGVHALTTAFDPPTVHLADPDLPVDLD